MTRYTIPLAFLVAGCSFAPEPTAATAEVQARAWASSLGLTTTAVTCRPYGREFFCDLRSASTVMPLICIEGGCFVRAQ